MTKSLLDVIEVPFTILAHLKAATPPLQLGLLILYRYFKTFLLTTFFFYSIFLLFLNTYRELTHIYNIN